MFSKYFKYLAVLTLLFLTAPFVLPIFEQNVYASNLYINISANPSSGYAPLSNVDLTASVSGSASGNITYKFDCTNDGTWEKTITTSNTSYTAIDLCSYDLPGSYGARIMVERDNLTFEGIAAIFVKSGPNLSVDLSANPSSGYVPLNDVDLTANVSGSASGNITYKFDCTSDGIWEKTITTGNTSYTAIDLCDYPNPGNYTAKVSVERDGLAFQGTAAIIVKAIPTLMVDLSANPSSGYAPLNNVDLTASVSGTASGNITYKFDCTNDGAWEKTITTSSNPYTATDLCNYSSPGNYTAKVKTEREGLTAEDTAIISVQEVQTLWLSISASPSSGYAPLNDVDLTASVSGTAQGDITYKFDCTSDGIWEKTITTGNTSYTAIDLCSYSSPGVYTVRVLAERGGLLIQGTINVVVGDVANLAVDFSTNPSSGKAPLNAVDLIAYISGTAQGTATYRFDCTNNGTWERVQSINSSGYTAYDICNYATPGVYTAKAQVERGGLLVEGTATIVVSAP